MADPRLATARLPVCDGDDDHHAGRSAPRRAAQSLEDRPARPCFAGGTTSLAGAPVVAGDVATVRLVRREAPSAESIFTDTPVVPPEVWQPLQMRRVRYFRKPTPPAASSAP